MATSAVTQDDLRAEGYRIIFRHYRVPEGTKNKDSRKCREMYPYSSTGYPWRPATCGGKTTCVILDRERRFVCRGVTFCRSDEVFSRKLGRNESFDNALEQWPA